MQEQRGIRLQKFLAQVWIQRRLGNCVLACEKKKYGNGVDVIFHGS